MAKQKNTKEIFSSIVIALLVVIMVVISALIVATVTSNSAFTDIPTTGTINNETLENVTNITVSTFAIKTTAPSATCTLTSLLTSVDEFVEEEGNYTFSSANCTLILDDDCAFIGDDMDATYDYTYASGTSLAGVNVTEISEDFGSFVTNLIAFLAIIGTIIGIIWLVLYVRKLFSKEDGIQEITR